VSDTRIAERWPDRNYGTQPSACAGNVAGAAREMLVAFDLGSIPSGADVTRATITVHRSTSGVARISAHRVTSSWDERSTTWQTFAGALDSEPIAVASLEADAGSMVTFDVTELVRGWQTGAYPNYGIALRQLAAVTGFTTSESDDVSARPQLDVCYW
jgi:hypothetical protein